MWALDLGTTNTVIAHWDADADRPRLVDLAELRRRQATVDRLELPAMVPSVVQIRERVPLVTKLTDWGPGRRWAWGTLADIGQQALDLNQGRSLAGFVPTFKRALAAAPLRPLATIGARSFNAREAAWLFLRELLKSTRNAVGKSLTSLTITTPVDAFESYRAELQAILRRLGLKHVKFVDEPVAAALGYGLTVARRRRALVVDFGGGTLDLALVELAPHDTERGVCRVLAKTGAAIGGDLVDEWLLEDLSHRLGYGDFRDGSAESRFWQHLLLGEARRIKEALFFQESVAFELLPPDELRSFEARLRHEPLDFSVTRSELIASLERRGLFGSLDALLAEIFRQASQVGVGQADVDDVLMVGGSTLLPGVFPRFEANFGRDRVRSWQPFEAVAYGACAHAAGQVRHADFVVHDYALLTYDATSGKPEYTVIVPRGTRVPTEPDFWKRQLVPTCALGAPERLFKLIICEIGEAGVEQSFGFDADGRVHKLGGRSADSAERLVVQLNQSNPTVGELNPPHLASDRQPRLEIAFGVNADRWLCASVLDLKTRKLLSREEPVVRLL
jgi:molecular chaperone DnaK (HSP70)